MRRRFRLVVTCSVVALCTFSVWCKAQSQPASYQVFSDRFFSLLQQDKTSEAIDYIFGTNPALAKKLSDQTEQLKAQIGSMRAVMGPYLSHTLLVESRVADSFVYQHYFVAYERQPISIRVMYYKPGSTWLCHGVFFDPELPKAIQLKADESIAISTRPGH